MKLVRRYQVLADQGTCHEPGCSWHWNGPQAEFFGETHAQATGHQVRVRTAADVILTTERQQLDPVTL